MLSNFYKKLICLGDSLIERLGNVLNILMIALVCVVIVVVIGRYFFDFGSVALQELTTYLHAIIFMLGISYTCLLYTSPSPRDRTRSRMPSSA